MSTLNYARPEILSLTLKGKEFLFYYRTEKELEEIHERIMQITKKEDKDYSEEEWEKFNNRVIHGREKELRKIKKMRKAMNGTTVVNSNGFFCNLHTFLEERQKSANVLASYWVGNMMLGLERNTSFVDAVKRWNPNLQPFYFDICSERLSFKQRNRVTISLKKE